MFEGGKCAPGDRENEGRHEESTKPAPGPGSSESRVGARLAPPSGCRAYPGLSVFFDRAATFCLTACARSVATSFPLSRSSTTSGRWVRSAACCSYWSAGVRDRRVDQQVAEANGEPEAEQFHGLLLFDTWPYAVSRRYPRDVDLNLAGWCL